jgi:hypothetical protein
MLASIVGKPEDASYPLFFERAHKIVFMLENLIICSNIININMEVMFRIP